MTAVVQPDSGELTVLMSAEEAEEITRKIKNFVGMVCFLVKEAHDKQAWRALGYPTWTAYCKAEFDIGKSRSYQLVKYAQVIALGADTTGLPESTIVDSLPESAARKVDPAAFVELLTGAFHDAPADITTRGELLAAVIEIATADPAPADESPEIPAPEDEAPAPSPSVPAPASGSDGVAPSPSSDPDPSPEQNAPEPRTARNDDAAPATGGKVGSPPDLPAPELPEDWRKRLADSLHLLGLDPALVAAHATDDDRIELADLAVWIETFHQATEEQA